MPFDFSLIIIFITIFTIVDIWINIYKKYEIFDYRVSCGKKIEKNETQALFKKRKIRHTGYILHNIIMYLLLQSTVDTVMLHNACVTALSYRLNVHTMKNNKRKYTIKNKINRTVFLRYSDLRLYCDECVYRVANLREWTYINLR